MPRHYKPGRVEGTLLTLLEPTGRTRGHNTIWKVRCDCGNIIEKPPTDILYGTTRSCGCLRRKVGLNKIKQVNAEGRNLYRNPFASLLAAWK